MVVALIRLARRRAGLHPTVRAAELAAIRAQASTLDVADREYLAALLAEHEQAAA